jgi:hypothetical protein
MSLPTAGAIYLDTNTVIYSMEKHPEYWAIMRPLWLAAQQRATRLVASELLVLEALVGPIR